MPEDIIIEEEIVIPEDHIQEQAHSIFEAVLADLTAANAIPVTFDISEAEKQKAIEAAEDYLINRNKKIEDMSFYTIYTVISKLNEDDQIKFFKENIDYIRKNDNEIFLYDMLVPNSLTHYLSINVLKELHKLDKKIIKKIMKGSLENLFWGSCKVSHLDIFDSFYDEINDMDNYKFINSLSYTTTRILTSDEDLGEKLKHSNEERKSLISFICKKYKSKINTFTPEEIVNFIHYVEDLDLYKEFINEYKDKITVFFETAPYEELKTFLNENSGENQEIFISTFFDNIIKNPSFSDFASSLDTNVIIKKYKEKNKLDLSLSDLIKSSVGNNVYNEDLIKMLNEYEIDNIEQLFDTKFYRNSGWYQRDVRALKYIENKYRNNIVIDGNLFDIDENTSIFSSEYLKNLKELKKLLKEKSITKDSLIYQKHFKNFILYLKNNEIINKLDELGINEINILFCRIVMGESMTVLYKCTNINEITLYNRLRSLEINSKLFAIEQLKKYNVKQHKQLCNICNCHKMLSMVNQTLILKLMLLVGYKHAKEILEIDNDLTTLEHLVGSVNVCNIKLDEQGSPILNKKIINLLFSDKENTKIKEMLANKNGELYEFFPRLFSEWDAIKQSGKDKSLKQVIELLKSDSIILPSEYYRLQGCFRYIGCTKDKVEETLKLHDKILEREETTIPKVSGKVGDYTYEILDLHDMYGLTVGNRTNCCFTVKGISYSSLKHACTSKNGRILVIKKNDELIAHSWLWRNGNLLCLDNIEVNKGIKEINFLDVYLDFADEIINKSLELEGVESIKNITIGNTNFDKPIIGIENYVSLVLENEQRKTTNNMNKLKKLPQPIEAIEGYLYTDSKFVQYLIRGNGNFKLGQTNYFYKEKENENIKQKVLVGGKI